MRNLSITGLTVFACLTLILTSVLLAGDCGRIQGTITDKETGQPIPGTSVLVIGTVFGAATDPGGYFRINRLQPGTYTLRISHIDYNTVEIAEVVITADSTVEISQALTRKATNLDQTVTVVGRHKIIDKFVVGAQVNMSEAGIKSNSAQAPGVAIRGCRAGTVSSVPLSHGGNTTVNNEACDAMFFKHYGVNPFVDTEDDHLSTFATDIDDASFIMTRSYLEGSNLPPADAVRTEEFVNHFDYGYTSPDDEPFAIHLEGAPSKFGGKSVKLLRIGIKGIEIRPEERKVANLVFVVDVSGSMGWGNRLGLVRQALRLLVDELTGEDRVGIAVYGSRGRVVLQPTSIEFKDKIISAIESLQPEGATNAEEGIRLGYEMADEVFEQGKINRVILCSDGVANVGRTGPDQILKQIKKYADRGITLSTVGFGMGNFNDVLMEKLGNKGNGHYAYVDDLEEARRIFVDNLTGTLQVIARDVKIQVDFNPEIVRSYRLLGFENRDVDDDKFRDDTEDGGEIGSDHACTALYELKLHREVAEETLATVYIRYKDPDTREVTEINRRATAKDLADNFNATSHSFRLAAAAAEFAEILRKSYWAREGQLTAVLSLTSSVYFETEDQQVLELMGLIAKADQFSDQLAEK